MAKRKILQIIPAEGWLAEYKEDHASTSKVPLACWALVEEEEDGETFTSVVGMDAVDKEVDFVDVSGFVGYHHA